MGGFTIYCPISGLPLEVSFDYEINNNDIKYGHLNEAIVILPDGEITVIGTHDGYGRVETDNEIFSCHDEEDKKYRYGIAISHCVYKLMSLHPKFQDFRNNSKNLFDYIKSYCNRINSPVMKYNGAQYIHLVDISQKDIPYFVDPFLEEKIEEPLLGETPKRGTRKIDGNKNKELLNKIIDDFLDFIPKTKEEKSNDLRQFMLDSQKKMIEDNGIPTISEDNMKEFEQMNIK